jgi:hypothetical protein
MTTTNTNPGLVNVADQAFKPDLRVDSLAVPLDDDVLVPVADQEIDPVTGNPLAVTFPTPAEVIVGEQVPGSPSQDFGQVPGVPPLYLPFPPRPTDPNVQNQSVTAGTIAEFTVGADISIQTNQTPATVEDYTITAVLDADTGQPPVNPPPVTTGNFTSVVDAGSGKITLVASAPVTLLAGSKVTIAGSTVPAYNGVNTVYNPISLSGTFDIAIDAGGGVTTFGSPTTLPPTLLASQQVTISGSSVGGYNGTRAASNVVSLAGTFSSVASTDPPGAQIIIVSPTALPAGLVDGQLVFLSGSYGWKTANNIVNISGSFASAADSAYSPGIQTTFTSVGVLPAALQNGQQITIAGTTDYDGTWEVLNVTANTFDIVKAFSATKAGNWAVWNFTVTAALGTASGTWAANTFDMVVAFSATATGNWAAYTFDVVGTFSATGTGSWSYQAPSAPPATRYKLVVTPPNLTSFGISMLGRQIIFDDDTITADDEGAARNITGYGWNWIVIDKNDPADLSVPALVDPQVGDTFTLDTQRQASEVVSAVALTPVNVNVSTGTQPIQGAANVFVV